MRSLASLGHHPSEAFLTALCETCARRRLEGFDAPVRACVCAGCIYGVCGLACVLRNWRAVWGRLEGFDAPMRAWALVFCRVSLVGCVGGVRCGAASKGSTPRCARGLWCFAACLSWVVWGLACVCLALVNPSPPITLPTKHTNTQVSPIF